MDELNAIKGQYNPREIYEGNPLLRRAMDTLIDGTFEDGDGMLRELYEALLNGASWHAPDHYFVLKDFDAYMQARLRANRDYRDIRAFSEKCLRNVAGAGKFSADRTIEQYAREIWNL